MAYITIKKTETDPAKGVYPEKRPIKEHIEYGIINLDKPSGPTSHLVTSYVKGILKIKKAGHSGTLDPGVSGVLPIALEKSTRIMEIFLKTGKEYVCLMKIHKDIDDSALAHIIKKFTGKIQQLPPVRSAVKRQLREREIYEIKITERKNRYVLFNVKCQAGTYIRKLCSDIGNLIGGAHMQELRRIGVGPFAESNLTTLHELKDNYEFWKKDSDENGLRKNIIPLENTLKFIKKVYVHDSAIENLCNGADLYIGGVSYLDDNIKKDETIAVMSLKGELISLGISKFGSAGFSSATGCVVRTGKTFMKLGTYA